MRIRSSKSNQKLGCTFKQLKMVSRRKYAVFGKIKKGAQWLYISSLVIDSNPFLHGFDMLYHISPFLLLFLAFYWLTAAIVVSVVSPFLGRTVQLCLKETDQHFCSSQHDKVGIPYRFPKSWIPVGKMQHRLSKSVTRSDMFSQAGLIVNRMIPVPDVTNSIPEHLAFVSSSVSMAATEVRLIFLEMGT